MNLAVLPALIDWQPRTRLIFGPGVVARAGALAAELHLHDVLLVCDEGIERAGYADTVQDLLERERICVTRFSEFSENPDGDQCAAAAEIIKGCCIKGIVALGGGSSLDCAKGANFLQADGGQIADFRGYGKVRGTMLPMIGIPTTAGTGSDAQSYAVLSEARTHVKMACGDPGAAFRIALLDPVLTCSKPATSAFQRTTCGSISDTAIPCVTSNCAVSGLAQAWAAPSIECSMARPATCAPRSIAPRASRS